MNEKLVAKVKAVNAANDAANKFFDKLVEIFRPLVGTTVLKADGSLLKRVESLLPEFPYQGNLRVWRQRILGCVMWGVQACEHVQGQQCVVYHETAVYIANLVGGVLTSLYNPEDRRTDYTVEEIETKRANYKEAKRLADNAFSALYPFGEHDK